MARRSGVVAGFAVVTALLTIYVARHFEVSSELTRFLDSGDDSEVAGVALRIADSPQARTIVLGIGGPDVLASVRAAREWSSEIARQPEVESVRSGPDPGLVQSAFELYFPRRLLFLSSDPETEVPALLSEAGLRDAARRLREALGTPEGALLEQHAAADPLLAFASRLRALQSLSRGSLRTRDRGFVAGDPPRAILFVTTRHSAFDSSRQGPLLAMIEQSFAALNARQGAALSLEISGVHRFALRSESIARADAAWLSTVSLVGLAICFVAIYRSVAVLVLTFVPLAFGMLVATAATLAWLGRVHSLTLAFGAALVGICTDYPLHLVTHWVMRPPGQPLREAVARIRMPLVLAAGTSCAGFWALGSSRIPGIREVGAFAAIGVGAACFSTIVLVPQLMGRSIQATSLQHAWIAALRRRRRHSRVIAAALVVSALAVCAVGLRRVEWNDDVFGLNAPLDPVLLAEDRALRMAVGEPDLGRLVISAASDDEAALRLVEAAEPRLVALRRSGAIEAFHSVHALIWSRSLQERNARAIAAQRDVAERFTRAFAAEGFRPERFSELTAQPDGRAPEPLGIADLLASPLRDAVAPFRIPLDSGRVALVTFLQGVRDPGAVAAALADLPGVRLFDQQRFAHSLYARYRARALELVGAGALAVVLLLAIRYRDTRRTALATAPALLGAAFTISLLAVTGTPVGLLHVLGLLLVLSLGVDYGIFLVESSSDPSEEGASLLSVTLDCATTLLSFGLLAASSFPALRALGLSTGIGVAATLAFAFAFRALLQRAAPEGER